MEPLPARSMIGSTARMSLNGAVRLIAMTLSHTASVVSLVGEKSSLMPAMFARPSMVSPAAAMTASIASCVVRSPATVVMSASGNSALRASSFSVEMSAAMTRPPSQAMRTAVALPMPDAAPVTMTVLWVKRAPAGLQELRLRSGSLRRSLRGRGRR